MAATQRRGAADTGEHKVVVRTNQLSVSARVTHSSSSPGPSASTQPLTHTAPRLCRSYGQGVAASQAASRPSAFASRCCCAFLSFFACCFWPSALSSLAWILACSSAVVAAASAACRRSTLVCWCSKTAVTWARACCALVTCCSCLAQGSLPGLSAWASVPVPRDRAAVAAATASVREYFMDAPSPVTCARYLSPTSAGVTSKLQLRSAPAVAHGRRPPTSSQPDGWQSITRGALSPAHAPGIGVGEPLRGPSWVLAIGCLLATALATVATQHPLEQSRVGRPGRHQGVARNASCGVPQQEDDCDDVVKGSDDRQELGQQVDR